MKGTIRIRVTPKKKDVERIRTAVNLKDIDAHGKVRLVKSFLHGLEISYDDAKFFIDLLQNVEENKEKEAPHE